jgi:hypothetical protein
VVQPTTSICAHVDLFKKSTATRNALLVGQVLSHAGRGVTQTLHQYYGDACASKGSVNLTTPFPAFGQEWVLLSSGCLGASFLLDTLTGTWGVRRWTLVSNATTEQRCCHATITQQKLESSVCRLALHKRPARK